MCSKKHLRGWESLYWPQRSLMLIFDFAASIILKHSVWQISSFMDIPLSLPSFSMLEIIYDNERRSSLRLWLLNYSWLRLENSKFPQKLSVFYIDLCWPVCKSLYLVANPKSIRWIELFLKEHSSELRS